MANPPEKWSDQFLQSMRREGDPLAGETIAKIFQRGDLGKVNSLLWLTQRLQEHVLRRTVETAQMVIAVMRPGGLGPGGSGFRTAAKVRLMHAAIRRLILHGRPETQSAQPANFAEVLLTVRWNTEELGYPSSPARRSAVLECGACRRRSVWRPK